MARRVVEATRYSKGIRGFSGSPRAAGYGRQTMSEYIRSADEAVSVICQIEDHDGVENCYEIASVQNVDCLFIGLADLMIAFGADSPTDEKVISAVDKIIGAGKAAKCPIGIFLPTLSKVKQYLEAGVSVFVLGTDQSILMQSANELANTFEGFLKEMQ
jgi:2-keto-3-deoxy-L-rhamnonate aldolase RhmA